MKKVLLGCICLSCVSCGGAFGVIGGDAGYFEMRGDVRGLQAYMDGQNGLITNGKASPDAADTPSYDLRRQQVESRRAIRIYRHGKQSRRQ